VCGILGLLLHDTAVNAAPEISEGLSLLQHRGQDACGIITGGPRGRLYQCKANGMVRDVFTQDAIMRLIGGMGIGHGEPFFPIGTSLEQRVSFCLVAPALVCPFK
jgi:amidophosphoribosyltransferase